MKTIVIKNSYGLENIVVEERPIPVVRENEVLVRVQSLALNQLDLMIAAGAFKTALPHVLGSDAAGIVEKVGSNVTQFKIGDRVVSHFIQSWQSGPLQLHDLNSRLGTTVAGVFSEYIALAETSLVQIPESLSVVEASTLPIAGLTAWEALVNIGQLIPGQTLLLQGTGGVSIFALQWAKSMGLQVIITSSSDDKLQRAKELGADVTINYKKQPHWEHIVLESTEGLGVDMALEMSWNTIDKTITSVKLGGKIAVVGLLGGANADVSVFGIMQKSLTITGVQTGSRASFTAMNHAIQQLKIKPVIGRIYDISQLSEAIDFFKAGKHFGKVVVHF